MYRTRIQAVIPLKLLRCGLHVPFNRQFEDPFQSDSDPNLPAASDSLVAHSSYRNALRGPPSPRALTLRWTTTRLWHRMDPT